MMRFKVDVTVLPKDGVLDTQGKAVEKTLHASGYDAARDVRVGKFIRLTVDAADKSAAEKLVREIADDMLTNDLVESYKFDLEEVR